MSEYDDSSPLFDVLRSDAVGDMVGRVTIHTENTASLHCHLGYRCGHSDWFEGKLKLGTS